ncbi:MAG: FAD-binding oxidoreductase [Rhodobacteraceae bacterium]|nr:FAD-binding oxidoreductase [Paracoccaceae bacterium]
MDILTANDQIGAYPASWYAASAEPLVPYLEAVGALSCDVCVVGAGFTGLSAALHLADRGFDVILLDANRVGWGASGRNGGQVGTGHRLDQEELEAMVGQTRAHALWQLARESVALTRTLAGIYAPSSEFTPGIIHACHRARFLPHVRAYAEKLARDYDYTQIHVFDREEMRHMVGSPAYHGGNIDMGGGHLHPLRYAFGLAYGAAGKGVRIHEKTRVTRIEPGDPAVVVTQKARISARHVVLACNGYLGGLDPQVAARVMPINNYIVATEPMSPEVQETFIRNNHAVADTKFVVNYFRFSDDHRLLFGGAESYGYRFPKDIAALVRKPMLEIFPQLAKAKITHAWGGTLAITMNRMPHFAMLRGNILSASGYSGHGVAMATMAGKLAAEAIAGHAERFDLMSAIPTPRFPGGVALRWPLLVAAMLWYSMRDKL